MSTEPISPSLSSRGSGSVAGRKFFTGSSFNNGQGVFAQGSSPNQGRAASSSLASNQGGSPFASGATPDTPGMKPAGYKTLPEEESYLQSTQASQGSLDTNRDLAIGSTGSIGNQSELTNEVTGMSYTHSLSDGVPDSAADLAQPVSSTAGTTAGTSAMSSLPPSASWGAGPLDPSPTPANTPGPTPAVAQQPAETLASEPYEHSSVGLAETMPEQSSSTDFGAFGGHSPTAHEAEVAYSLPDTNRQVPIPYETAQDGFNEQGFEPVAASAPLQDTFTEHRFEPATATVPLQGGVGQAATTAAPPHDGAGNQDVLEAPGRAKEQVLQMQQAGLGTTAQDGLAAQAFEQPTQRAQRDQIDEPVYAAQGAGSAQTLQHEFVEDSVEQPAQREQVSAYSAQGAVAAPTVQDRQTGFSDDIFAQFSPLTSRSNQSQQANPFAPATVASPVVQEPVLESAQPVELSMKVSLVAQLSG